MASWRPLTAPPTHRSTDPPPHRPTDPPTSVQVRALALDLLRYVRLREHLPEIDEGGSGVLPRGMARAMADAFQEADRAAVEVAIQT